VASTTRLGVDVNHIPLSEDNDALVWGRRYFLLAYGLVVLGLVFVFSSSFPLAGRPTPGYGDAYSFLKSQLLFATVGLVAMWIISHVRPRWLAALSLPGLFVGLVLMILAIILGRQVGHSRCWLPLPWGGKLQPSEFAKLAYVIFCATMLNRGPVSWENRYTVILPIVAATAAMVVVLVEQSDQGMAMLILLIALAMALLGGARWQYLVPTGLGLLGAGLAFAATKPHIWRRILAWLHPGEYLQGPGYHIYNMLIALARGGFVGTGLGMSPDKWKNLPVPHTDSIYCVIGGELGTWGAVGVMVLMVLLTAWAFRIARASGSRLGWLLAATVGLSLTLQALVNMAVATASIPTTGLTLPFISAGGSSLISSLMGIGVVLSVARHSQRAAQG